MSLGQMVVELSLDGDQFTVNLKKADGQLAQFIQGTGQADRALQRAERSTRSWGHALRDGVIVLSLIRSAIQNVTDGLFGWQRSIVGVNAEIQRSIALMKSFSTQSTEVAKSQEAIAEVRMLMQKAASAPFDMSAITDSFVKLRVSGIENTKRSLDTLIDSVAAFGGTGENLKRASVAIQQMAGKGVVSMEELRQQLGESVPTAIQAMADGLGTTYDALVKQISLGRVKAGPAVKAMMDELERSFAGRAESMMNSWTGAVAQFQTSLKNLSASFGGLEDTGYSKGGYMGTLVTELRGLSDLMNSPTMIDSARDLGQAIAEIVKAAADGVRWIVENKEAILDWGKAILTTFAIMKSGSYALSFLESLKSISAALGATKSAGTQMIGVWGNLKGAMESQSQAAARQSAAAAAGATAMSRWGMAASAASGALSVLGGPLGIVAGLAISGGVAWYNYQKEVEATRDAVIELNGALTNADQLAVLDKVVNEYESKMNAAMLRIQKRKNGIYSGSIFSFLDDERNAEDQSEYEQNQKLFEKSLADRYEGAKNVARREAQQLLDVEKRGIEEAYSQISSTYQNSHNKLLDQRRAGEIEQKEYDEGILNLRKQQGEQAISLISKKLETARAQEQLLAQEVANGGEKVSSQILAKYFAKKELIKLLEDDMIQQKESMLAVSQTLEQVLIGGGEGGKDLKFNPLVQYLNNLSVAVAKAGAKAEEENPHLAQLHQIVANMSSQGMKADPAMIAQGEKMAAARWEQEKATKALTEANNGYKNSVERLGQIEKVLSGKLGKAENDNPWLKASTDAQRYIDEVGGIEKAMAKYRETASGISGDAAASIVAEIDSAAGSVEKLERLAEKYSVQDTAKRMQEQSNSINDSLKTQSQAVEAQYQRQMAWALEYYQNHKQLLTEDAEAYASYQAYLASLDSKYKRDTESGLQTWIRENQDASEKYKSLWGSAMDSFSDTIADGLVEGKFQIADFVQYVLKELIKIQMAKMIAGIAGSIDIGGMFSSQQNVGSAAASAGYSTTGYAGAHGFANGGIMTQWGKAKLKQYANGGIAREPQVAVFGEGDMAEAYVPLPDGRTIPVTLQGNLNASAPSTQQTSAPQVMVNVINQSGQNMDAEQTGGRFNGEQYVVDVVLKAVSRPGPLRDAIKG